MLMPLLLLCPTTLSQSIRFVQVLSIPNMNLSTFSNMNPSTLGTSVTNLDVIFSGY